MDPKMIDWVAQCILNDNKKEKLLDYLETKEIQFKRMLIAQAESYMMNWTLQRDETVQCFVSEDAGVNLWEAFAQEVIERLKEHLTTESVS